MSADNWGICPKCKKLSKERAKSLYGKASEDEYLVYFLSEKSKGTKETLREDYEIYTDDDGEFSVGYDCSCDECGFSYHFQYKASVLPETP
jgi:hypothetical protein